MPSLSDYISLALNKGIEEEEIEETLLKKGYSQREINNAFDSIRPRKSQIDNENNTTASLNYFEKIKFLFSTPKEFFNVVREPNIGRAIGLYFVISLIVLGVSFGFSFILRGVYYSSLTNFFTGGFYSVFFAIVYILLFSFTFIYAGISYAIIKGFKGEGSYVDTYNACTYSLVPGILLSIIPLAGFLSLIYSIVIMTFGFSRYHSISSGKAVTAVMIPILIPLVLFVFLVFFLFFRVFPSIS